MPNINITTPELVWPGKYDEDGNLFEVDRPRLPFQKIETVNDTVTNRKKKAGQLTLFDLYTENTSDTMGDNWKNKLIWGDNKYILSGLLTNYTGKIDLIYIDPPFDVGADFSFQTGIGDYEITKKPSIIEQKAYRDTWGKGINSYLHMIYQRLILMKELLSETGSIFVHVDWHVGQYVKVVMDEIFGKENFVNEIIWQKIRTTKAQSYGFGNVHDNIFVYKKSNTKMYFENQYREFDPQYIKSHYKLEPETGRLYRTVSMLQKGQGHERQFGDEMLQPPTGMHWIWSQERINEAMDNGLIRFTSNGRPEKIQYLDEMKGDIIDDIWTDIYPINSQAKESLGYATQKPESLLERIINSACSKDGLVADFFCGSGTTLAVAEKLGRKWIGADLGRFAIHTTRKRLMEIEGCHPFEILNMGKYERKYWQGINFDKKDDSDEKHMIVLYIKFILDLYNAEPISGFDSIHGKKGRTLIHIGAVDAPVTMDEVNAAIMDCKQAGRNELHILGWEWEMGMNNPIVLEAKLQHDITLKLINIPREVMDKRAVDAGDVQFFNLAYLETDIETDKKNKKTIRISLKDFAIPDTELIPDEVRNKIKKWSDYIDYWAVDWNFMNDTFINQWQTYRTRQNRNLELLSDWHTYDKKGQYQILIKVVDIFGNDTSHLINIDIK